MRSPMEIGTFHGPMHTTIHATASFSHSGDHPLPPGLPLPLLTGTTAFRAALKAEIRFHAGVA
jgi:hypothetical protein